MPALSTGHPARRRRRACRQGGFTLVELLIALVLVSVITVLMFSGLRLGSRAWEGVEALSERVNDLRVARNFIEQTLRQTRPASVIFDGEQLPVFAGDAERLELAAPLSEHVGIPGLYILRLVREAAGDHDRLVLVRWLLHREVLEGGDDHPPWEPLLDSNVALDDAGPLDRDIAEGAYGRTVLLPRVETFELAYFGIGEGESEPEWFEEWVNQRRLPLKVRIALSTPAQAWPAAVVVLPGGDTENFGELSGGLDPAAPAPARQQAPAGDGAAAPEQPNGR
ncbi:prepilin-type N-terminal cleavage/methylation domain-containing protein [uncultured Thiohalocapsa sp.]|uniref:prepilin-type N-terminal cleavage/methylation domain-containing protein n=1 Tax=uncultured Thiohalocapsa sp. TaxID=768990 RepID=UPI0025E4B612|nr:prepilin-type N-terminal cleavage/methylation domain-containing protein [uncultured Thiohalocapsa sp.]